MKRVIIVHCWDGNPEYCWYPWLKRELEAKGVEVIVPAMPETSMPKMNLWVPALAEIVGKPDENTILVGHSIGCATIMRYLETLGETERIGGAVFIAGFTTDLGFEEIHNFFETPLNFQKIRSHLSRMVSIHSDDDPFVDLKYATILAEELGAKTTILEKMKHFSGSVDNEKSCVILPQALDAVMNML